MKVSVSKMIGIIIGVMTITGGLVTGAVNFYNYHDTLATKKEMNEKFLQAKKDRNIVYVNLRLRDVEDSIRFYQQKGISTLDHFGREHYEKLQKTLARLEAERDAILTGD